MKSKILFLGGAILIAICATACDKRCWCYEPDPYVGNRMTEFETWTDEGTLCHTLSYGKRNCVEDHERMDPSQIANPYNR